MVYSLRIKQGKLQKSLPRDADLVTPQPYSPGAESVSDQRLLSDRQYLARAMPYHLVLVIRTLIGRRGFIYLRDAGPTRTAGPMSASQIPVRFQTVVAMPWATRGACMVV